MILSTRSPVPWVLLYPDSDKVSGGPGRAELTDLNSLRLPGAGGVDYWFGEGTADPPPPDIVREPAGTTALPAVHLLDAAQGGPNALRAAEDREHGAPRRSRARAWRFRAPRASRAAQARPIRRGPSS